MSHCSQCNTENKAGAKFCKSCGTSTAAAGEGPLTCRSCSASLAAGAKFCKSCGAMAAVGQPANGIAPTVAPLVKETDEPVSGAAQSVLVPEAVMPEPPPIAATPVRPQAQESVATTQEAEKPLPAQAADAVGSGMSSTMQAPAPLQEQAQPVAQKVPLSSATSDHATKPAPVVTRRPTGMPMTAILGTGILAILLSGGGYYWWSAKQHAPSQQPAVSEAGKAPAEPAAAAAPVPADLTPVNATPATASASAASASVPEAPPAAIAGPAAEPPTPSSTKPPAAIGAPVARAVELAPSSTAPAAQASHAVKPVPAQKASVNRKEDLALQTTARQSDPIASKALALLSRAEGYLANRQYDKAIATAESALELDPSSAGAKAMISKAKSRQMDALKSGSSLE